MNQQVEFLKSLIRVAEKLAPNRVPNGDAEMLQIWAEVIPFEKYPHEVWQEAVLRWHRTEGEFLEASTLPRHAREVVRMWDLNQRKREILDNHRQSLLDARVERGELLAGTTPIRAPETPEDANSDGSSQQREELKRIRAEWKKKRWDQATIHERAKIRAKQEQHERQKAVEQRNRELAEQLKTERENL